MAHLPAMDRTTLTANLKSLERRGLLVVLPDPEDDRGRNLFQTDAGRDLLVCAVPVRRETQDPVDALLRTVPHEPMRQGLREQTFGQQD